jgi:hypothetical protein
MTQRNRVSLSAAQRRVLEALASGATLHRHRGESTAWLSPAGIGLVRVAERTCRTLLDAGLITEHRPDSSAFVYVITRAGDVALDGGSRPFFHRTSATHARSIVADGFRDARGRYLTDEDHEGVWLSSVPFDVNDGAAGDTLVLVRLPGKLIAPYEWVDRLTRGREFLVPAAVINKHGAARIVEG